ncbi:ribonuclease H family protein [Candidatus Palauibacter sp.]|uniref:ribonuclease H family protein n=1 Tax=Candidatus Palauibacter sp. TaxID=3101350 RepID=UPI003AF1FAC4
MRTDSGPGREGQAEAPLVHIFADESCLGNQFEDRENPGAAAGLIERFDERRGWHRRDFAHFDPDTTNNRMALVSGIVGLGALRQACRVVFTSDSQYLVRGMKEWVHGWARRGWRRKGGPIENLDLWQELSRAAARHRVEWRWTRGHAEDVKNVYAHTLAITAARERRGTGGLVPSSFEGWVAEAQEKGKFTDFLDLPDEAFHPDRQPPPI